MLSFLRSHPKLSGESVPWYLRSAGETAAAAGSFMERLLRTDICRHALGAFALS
jgi:hypothetical protein